MGIAPQDRLDRVLAALRGSPGQALGLGLVSALGLQLVSVVLMAVLVLTVIGIPIALLLGLVLGLLAVVAAGLTSAVLGGRLCEMVVGRCPSAWLALAIGMIVLHSVCFLGGLVGLSPSMGLVGTLLSGFGLLIKVFAYILGLGALIHSRFGSRPLTSSS